MGQIIIDKNADYSTQEVGIFDFENNIFRRKINGELEKNKIKSTVNTAHTSDYIEIADDVAQFRFNFYESINSGGNPIFGFADYANNRAIMIYIYMESNAESFIQFFVLSPSGTANMVKVQQSRITLGNLGTLDATIEHSLIANVKFSDTAVTSAKVDDVSVTPQYMGIVTEDRFAYKTNTLSLGTNPWIASVPIANVMSEISFFQYRNANDEIILHFDFLGDNETEILTDKAKLITLKNDGVQIVPV